MRIIRFKWVSRIPEVYMSKKNKRYIVLKIEEDFYLVDRGRFFLSFISPYFQQKVNNRVMKIDDSCTQEFKLFDPEAVKAEIKRNRNNTWEALEILVILGLISFFSGAHFLALDVRLVSFMIVIVLILLKILLGLINKKRLFEKTGIIFDPTVQMRFIFKQQWIALQIFSILFIVTLFMVSGILWAISIFFLTLFQLILNEVCLPTNVWMQVEEEEFVSEDRPQQKTARIFND